MSKLTPSPAPDHPLTTLPREDLDLIAELVLQSGSLKGLAESYSVSYPTIRARLDKTIERLRAAVERRTPDPVTALLADLVERNELSVSGARRLRSLIQTEAVRAGGAQPHAGTQE
jgi:hypothetical protein